MNKKFKMFMASLGIVSIIMSSVTSAQALKYDPDVDYYSLMKTMAKRGDAQSLYAGKTFEKLRNEKIKALGMKYKQTSFFSDYKKPSDIQNAMALHQRGWTMDDWDLLSRLINAEAGCEWMPDWVPRAVGSVVLNRVKSKNYPNTIRDVIYQSGQYGPVYDGSLYKPATAKSKANALYILLNGKTLPDGVIGQNGDPWGRIHSQYYDSILGTTIYFHY